MTQDFKNIVVFAHARSGTNFLVNQLSRLEGNASLYEVLRPDSEPYFDQFPSLIEPFAREYGCDGTAIRPDERHKIIRSDKIRHFDFLSRSFRDQGMKSFSCKIFPKHISRKELDAILERDDCVYLFLTRNRIDRYISHIKSDATRAYSNHDTTDLLLDLDLTSFLASEMARDVELQEFLDAVRTAGHRHSFLRYETDIDQPVAIMESRVAAALSAIGIDRPFRPRSEIAQGYSKQDSAPNWRNKVRSGHVMAAALSGLGLLSYAESPHLNDDLPNDKSEGHVIASTNQHGVQGDDGSDNSLTALGNEAICFSILQHSPLVTASTINFDRSFLAEWIGRPSTSLREKSGVHFLRPTWSMETSDLAPLARSIRRARTFNPGHRFVVMAANALEEDRLRDLGVDTIQASSLIFVDEKIWTAETNSLLDVPKTDALYVARFSRWKNHELAAKVTSLSLAYGHLDKPNLLTLSEMREVCPTAIFLNHALSDDGYRYFSRKEMHAIYRSSKTSLALSFVEGAFRAGIESQLSGVPVVSVAAQGGRHDFFAEDNSIIVEPTPDAVAKGVQDLIARRLSPEEVSRSTLRLLLEARRRFEDDASRILQENLGPTAAPFRIDALHDVFGNYRKFAEFVKVLS